MISGNNQGGVIITDNSTRNNIVAGNHIGLNVLGNAPIPNGGHGVYITNGSYNNIIGSNNDGSSDNLEGNKIAYNNVTTVDWIGYYAQGNYSSGPINAYGMAGVSSIS